MKCKNKLIKIIILFILPLIVFNALSIQSQEKISTIDTIDNYNVTINIIDKIALVEYDLKRDIEGMISLKIPEDAKITDISYNEYEFKNGILKLNINKNLKLKFLTKEIIKKSDNYYVLYAINDPYYIKNLNLKVVLPEYAVLDKKENVYPSTKISTNGINIILEWNKKNLDEKESFAIFAIFRKPSNNFWLLMTIIFAIVAILAGYIFQKFKIENAKKSKEKKELKLKELHLVESELLLIKKLKKLGGEAWQKKLQIESGFSKAKLCRIIRNLEERGLIKKIPLGNTNKIKLK